MKFRIGTLLFALLLAALPAMDSSSIHAAQISAEDLLRQLDGLETAYARRYDGSHVHLHASTATPSADASTPDRLTVSVLEFETEEQVADAFDNVLSGLVVRMILGEPDIDLETTPVEDLGDRAELFAGKEHDYTALLAVQDGNLGILVQAHGEDASIEDTMMDVARFMIDAEPSDEPVTPRFPASTTGGTFDIMPTQDDAEVLNGLVPMFDYDLILNGGTEPIDDMATPAGSGG